MSAAPALSRDLAAAQVKAATLIEALAGFDTDAVFLPPKVREALAARRGAGDRASPA